MNKNNIKKLDISDIVRIVFNDMKKIVQGEFHISDDSIIRFLEFYTISNYIQENENKDTISLRQIHKKKLVAKDRKYNYDKLQDFYTKLNQRQKYRLKAENELLKEMDTNKEYKAKAYRIKDKSKVKMSNIFQLDMLFNLHNSNESVKLTYNRIRRNNLHNIKYGNLKDLISYFDKQIEKSNLEYKNIQYYLIEKTINKEIITTMSYCYSQLKDSNISKEEIKRIFIAVLKIPIIDERHKYIETYSEGLSFIDKNILEIELEGVYRFIFYCITQIKKEIKYCKSNKIKLNYNKIKFKKIYKNGYKSKYKLRADFEASDFKEVMNMIKDFNDKYIEREETINVDRFKKERKLKLEFENITNQKKVEDCDELDF